MKKKMLSLALALVICLGLTLPAVAADDAWSCFSITASPRAVKLGRDVETLRTTFTEEVATATESNVQVVSGGTTITITNDGGAYDLYIYLQTYKKQGPDDVITGFDFETEKEVVFKNNAGKYYCAGGLEYLAAEITPFMETYEKQNICPAGNGMYWVAEANAHPGSGGIKLLKNGESVKLTFPEDGLNTLYSLNVEYYNIEEADSYWSTVNFFVDTKTAASLSEPEKPADPAPVESIPASGTAVASTQSVTVDGKKVEFQMYALLDEKGNPTNYVKMRDVAHVLNGTKAQFAVGYSKETGITVTTGQAYAPNGSEMNTPFSGDRAYKTGTGAVQVNGKPVELESIVLTDDAGGGFTYFKLRDLGTALGFKVDWSAEKGIYVETK